MLNTPRIKKITARAFKRYGRIIEHPLKNSHSKSINLFHIVIRDAKSPGWRIAYLIVRDKTIDRLEQHPLTFETFEPVKGRALLYLSCAPRRGRIDCFLLDRPVILKKGIWHGIVTRTREAEIKITENAAVKSHFWKVKLGLNHKLSGA